MYVFVVTLHIVLCLILVLVILMQPGKGGDISSAFGGGSSSQLFGSAGPGNFLTRGTSIVAGLFMVTSITLALYSTESTQGGAVEGDLEKVLEEGEEGSGFGAGGTDAPAPAPADAPAAPAPAPAPAPDAAPALAPSDAPPAPAEGGSAPASP